MSCLYGIFVDGVTKAPTAFTGPIGKLLTDCEKLPVVKFDKIFSGDMPVLPHEVVNDLSVDQKYLYSMVQAVQSGTCDVVLASKKPGPLNHARFCTLACRVLRLYVATLKPTNNLKTLVKFIVKVYAPLWFSVKIKPNFADGPRHLFKFIRLIDYLPTNLKTMAQQVLQNNAYFLHSENLLATMLVDPQIETRKKAVKLVNLARNSNRNVVRTFEKPKVNFKAKYYDELIDWNCAALMEPPVTKLLTDVQLTDCINTADNKVAEYIYKMPCHTQAVERMVRVVTNTSTQ